MLSFLTYLGLAASSGSRRTLISPALRASSRGRGKAGSYWLLAIDHFAQRNLSCASLAIREALPIRRARRLPVSSLPRCSGQARSTRLMLAQGRPFTFHLSPFTFILSRDEPHLLEPGKQAEQHFFGIHPFEEPVLP